MLPLNSPLTQPVNSLLRSALGSSEETTSDKDTQVEGGFDTQLRALLTPDANNATNEEELFAAILHQRIQSLKGDGAAEDFEVQLGKRKAALTRGDGYVNVEKAAKQALGDMVSAEHMTKEEAQMIRAEAFQAAQLDDNHDALYDGRGSEGDATIATADVETALLAA